MFPYKGFGSATRPYACSRIVFECACLHNGLRGFSRVAGGREEEKSPFVKIRFCEPLRKAFESKKNNRIMVEMYKFLLGREFLPIGKKWTLALKHSLRIRNPRQALTWTDNSNLAGFKLHSNSLLLGIHSACSVLDHERALAFWDSADFGKPWRKFFNVEVYTFVAMGMVRKRRFDEALSILDVLTLDSRCDLTRCAHGNQLMIALAAFQNDKNLFLTVYRKNRRKKHLFTIIQTVAHLSESPELQEWVISEMKALGIISKEIPSEHLVEESYLHLRYSIACTRGQRKECQHIAAELFRKDPIFTCRLYVTDALLNFISTACFDRLAPLYEFCKRRSFIFKKQICIKFINACKMKGDSELAIKIWDEMSTRYSQVTLPPPAANFMIESLVERGRYLEAKEIFNRLKQKTGFTLHDRHFLKSQFRFAIGLSNKASPANHSTFEEESLEERIAASVKRIIKLDIPSASFKANLISSADV